MKSIGLTGCHTPFPPDGLYLCRFDRLRYFGASSRIASVLRSEEHTSELQSQSNLVCRLLLEKKQSTRQTSPLGRPSAVRMSAAPWPRPLRPHSRPLPSERPQPVLPHPATVSHAIPLLRRARL